MPALGLSHDNLTFPFASQLLCRLRRSPCWHQAPLLHPLHRFARHLLIANALIDMYGKCDQITLASRVFYEMPLRDLVSYNALLCAHAHLGENMLSARKIFEEMSDCNVISWNAMIVGYVNAGDFAVVRTIFDGIPDCNVVSWTVMMVGYCKNGLLISVRELFDDMLQRNLVNNCRL